MAIVKDFYIGKTHILINDEAVVKTEEEVQAILKRCAEIVAREEERKWRESILSEEKE